MNHTTKQESPREVAGQIAIEHGHLYNSRLVDAIEAALLARDERAAKIAETAFSPAHTYTSENAERYHAFDDGQKHAINKIAAAIRKE